MARRAVGTVESSSVSGQTALFCVEELDRVGEVGLRPIRAKMLEPPCERCPLSKTRTNVVFGEGASVRPPICIVGEAPGADEDRTGRPFVGRAGQLLDKMLASIGLKREDVFICNTVSCRPPQNRKPEKGELAACREFLLGQIQAVKPQSILTMGATATIAFLKGTKTISDLRGRWYEWEGVPLLPTFHPSYLLRNQDPQVRTLVWTDLKMLATRLSLPIFDPKKKPESEQLQPEGTSHPF